MHDKTNSKGTASYNCLTCKSHRDPSTQNFSFRFNQIISLFIAVKLALFIFSVILTYSQLPYRYFNTQLPYRYFNDL